MSNKPNKAEVAKKSSVVRSQEASQWVSFLANMKYPFVCNDDMSDDMVIATGKSFKANIEAEKGREKAIYLAGLKSDHITCKTVVDFIKDYGQKYLPYAIQDMESGAKSEWIKGGSSEVDNGKAYITRQLKIVDTEPSDATKKAIEARKAINEQIDKDHKALVESKIGLKWLNEYYTEKMLDKETMSEGVLTVKIDDRYSVVFSLGKRMGKSEDSE